MSLSEFRSEDLLTAKELVIYFLDYFKISLEEDHDDRERYKNLPGNEWERDEMLKAVSVVLKQKTGSWPDDFKDDKLYVFVLSMTSEDFSDSGNLDEKIVLYKRLIELEDENPKILAMIETMDGIKAQVLSPNFKTMEDLLTVEFLKNLHKDMYADEGENDETTKGLLISDIPNEKDQERYIRSHIEKRNVYYPNGDTIKEELSRYLRFMGKMWDFLYLQLKEEEKKGHIPQELIERLIKLFTWSYDIIMSLHPFRDGNGRICALVFYLLQIRLCDIPIEPYRGYSSTTKINYERLLDMSRVKSEGLGRDPAKDWSGRRKPEGLTAMTLESFFQTLKLAERKRKRSNSLEDSHIAHRKR